MSGTTTIKGVATAATFPKLCSACKIRVVMLKEICPVSLVSSYQSTFCKSSRYRSEPDTRRCTWKSIMAVKSRLDHLNADGDQIHRLEASVYPVRGNSWLVTGTRNEFLACLGPAIKGQNFTDGSALMTYWPSVVSGTSVGPLVIFTTHSISFETLFSSISFISASSPHSEWSSLTSKWQKCRPISGLSWEQYTNDSQSQFQNFSSYTFLVCSALPFVACLLETSASSTRFGTISIRLLFLKLGL